MPTVCLLITKNCQSFSGVLEALNFRFLAGAKKAQGDKRLFTVNLFFFPLPW
jgi:hypothetical protein